MAEFAENQLRRRIDECRERLLALESWSEHPATALLLADIARWKEERRAENEDMEFGPGTKAGSDAILYVALQSSNRGAASAFRRVESWIRDERELLRGQILKCEAQLTPGGAGSAKASYHSQLDGLYPEEPAEPDHP